METYNQTDYKMVVLFKLAGIGLVFVVLYPLVPLWITIPFIWLILRQSMKPHLIE